MYDHATSALQRPQSPVENALDSLFANITECEASASSLESAIQKVLLPSDRDDAPPPKDEPKPAACTLVDIIDDASRRIAALRRQLTRLQSRSQL